MKSLLTVLLLLSCHLVNAQEWEWARRVNGVANDYTSDLFIDDFSNIYITGRSKYSVTFEDPINPISPIWYGHTDAYVAKYDKHGNLLWATQGGGPEPDWGWGIVADNAGNSYYTGEFSDTAVFGNDTLISQGNRDVFVAKLNVNGNFVWAKSFGGTLGDKGQDIEMDNDGNLYITGYIGTEVTVGTTTLGTNSIANGYIIKLDTAGNYIHAKNVGPSFSKGYHLKADDNGHIYLSGELRYNSTVSIAGLSLTGPGYSWRDAYIAKLDTSLNPIWAQTGAGPFQNLGESIAISDNYVYLTGCFSGYADFSGTTINSNGNGTTSTTHNAARDMFIAKYDFSGNLIWVESFGGTGFDFAYGIDVTHDDIIYVGGVFNDTVMFDNYQLISQENADMFFIKLNSNGDVTWAKQQSGSAVDYCYAVAVDELENLYAVGGYRANIFFDNIYMPFVENTGFVGKITQHPDPGMVFTDSIICYGDTISIMTNSITSPVSYEFLLNQPSLDTFSIDGNLYLVIDSSFNLSGQVIASNNIYSDTIHFSQPLTYSGNLPFQLGNDTTICENESLVLYSPNTVFDKVWIDNTTNDSITVAQAGDYWLRLTDSLGCIQTDTINISHFDTPIQFTLGNDTNICDLNPITLSGPIGNYTYIWSTNDNSASITTDTSGIYTLTISDTNQCTASDTISVTYLDCLTLDESDLNANMHLYNNYLLVDTDIENYKVIIYNTLGQRIAEYSNENQIHLINLSSGVYIAILETRENQHLALKFNVN